MINTGGAEQELIEKQDATIKELQAVVDRLADKTVYFIDDERCKSFEEWVSKEHNARIEYAQQHATKEDNDK